MESSIAKPVLWILFPVYNTGEPLREFLTELRETLPFLEGLGVDHHCIAVNDASTDNITLEILRNPPISTLTLNRDKNGGCCEGLATALGRVADVSASQDIMCWLDPDCEHQPMHLVTLLSILQRGTADLALLQIIWREHHMLEYDRKLQEGMGALEAQVILGLEHRWHQHCPGCWMVRVEYIKDKGAARLFRDYICFYQQQEGESPRWGEDMTFVQCVKSLGGRINYDTITLSHMPAPNRPSHKVISQFAHALAHLRLYPQFFTPQRLKTMIAEK